MKWKVLTLAFLIIFLLSFASFLFYPDASVEAEPFSASFTPAERHAITYEEPIRTITIGMAGDILLHNGLNNYQDYGPSFEKVKEMTNSLDYFIVNQESLAAGEEFGISGYPAFNSTERILDTVDELGTDLVMISNNHTLDKGPRALRQSIQNLKDRELEYIGAYESQEDADRDRIISFGGVKIGILSYTYGMNGIPLPVDQPYLVNLIDIAQMQQDLDRLNALVDYSMVLVHWGTEYELYPNDDQRYITNMLVDAGADFIFGSHPHVLQPYELVEQSGNQAHVFYSLGNFFSGQTITNTNYGGVAVFTLTLDGPRVVDVSPSFYPTEVVRENSRSLVVPAGAEQASRWLTHLGVDAFETKSQKLFK